MRVVLYSSIFALAFFALSCVKPLDEQQTELPEATNTWLLSSDDDINNYTSFNPVNTYTLFMAKGETEHVQLVINTDSNKELDIVRKADQDAPDFLCRKLAVFDGMEDVLVPCHTKVKPDKKTVKLWLSYTTTLTSKAGSYSDYISLKSETAEYIVKITVTVKDVEIPSTPSIPAVFGINPATFDDTGLSSTEKVAQRKEVSDLLLSYRISPYFCTWIAGTMVLECTSSPYPVTSNECWEYMKDPRFKAVALPSANLSDEELGNMLSKARSEGLLGKAYFYLWDEPTRMEEYEKLRGKADRIHQLAPEAKILTTYYCGPKDGPYKDNLFAVWPILRGATSIFCTGVWSLQGNESRSEMCRTNLQDGEEWWCYVCMSDYPGLAANSAGIPNRMIMLREWKEKSQGFLFWVVNAFSSLSPLSPRSDLPKGDGCLVFPGKPFGVEAPCVSVRLERWRDGAEDYELLVNYENVLGRNAAEDMLKNVYQSPGAFTTNTKYVKSFHKHLIIDVL